MKRERETATIEYDHVQAETDNSIGFVVDGELIWIPRSEIIDHDEDAKTVEISEWLAIKKELV